MCEDQLRVFTQVTPSEDRKEYFSPSHPPHVGIISLFVPPGTWHYLPAWHSSSLGSLCWAQHGFALLSRLYTQCSAPPLDSLSGRSQRQGQPPGVYSPSQIGLWLLYLWEDWGHCPGWQGAGKRPAWYLVSILDMKKRLAMASIVA